MRSSEKTGRKRRLFAHSTMVRKRMRRTKTDMLLRRLVLENFGVFRDRNELDLTPQIRYRKRRPVILIGGKNGSGKTTLLEALRLCLYGQMALGSRVGVREYEAYLADRIHRAEGGDLYQAPSAAV